MKFKFQPIHITALLVIGVIAIAHTLHVFSLLNVEKYVDDKKAGNLNELIPSNKLAVFQGVTANNVPVKTIQFEDDSMKPSVDGSPSGPKSMFMFAYNKTSPECCLGERSSGYSTSGGCVCVTDKQKKYFSENAKTLENLDKCVFP